MIVPNKISKLNKNNAPTSSSQKPNDEDDDWMNVLLKAESTIIKNPTKTKVAPMDNPARNPNIVKMPMYEPPIRAAPVLETKPMFVAPPIQNLPPPPPPVPVISTVLIRDAEMAQHVQQKRAMENRVVTKSAIKRIAGGEVWEDKTMADWDKNDYRLFVGNLGYEASDDLLVKTFSHYPSFRKARVIRDKKSGRCKGFGFLSFANAEDYIKATKEFNGKYVGNRPIKLTRSKWEKRQFSEVKKDEKKKRKLKKMLKDE